MYVGAEDGLLYAINPNGTLKWNRDVGTYKSSPAVADDGTIYVTGRDYLWSLDPDGHVKWSCPIGGNTSSSPAIGADGTIYVGSSDNKLYAVGPDGSVVWSHLTGDAVASSSAIGSDGTIYVGSTDHRFYAVTTLPPDNIFINEVDVGNPEWIEPYNAGGQAVDMTGWHFIAYDSSGTVDVDYTFPTDFTLQPGDFGAT